MIKDFKLDIKFKDSAKPVFMKPRSVPFAVQELNEAYNAVIKKGVWKETQFSLYSTPLVPIRKKYVRGLKRSKIRICGDYSVTVNPYLEPRRYPILLPSDLMRKISGGQYFTKIDLTGAYNQILLSPDSQKRLALSTHRGVLPQQRLLSVSDLAPGYFQEIMDKLTQDLPGVSVYIDDILISGVSPEDHLLNVRKIVQRLKEEDLRCRIEKCVFAQSSVGYLSFNLSKKGISKSHKDNAVINMLAPKNVFDLKSFLGQLQFYNKFISS